MVTEFEEKRFWEEKENKEQIDYLKWQREAASLKMAMRELARLREEYVLSQKICSNYQGRDVAAKDLKEAVTGSFILERHSVVSQSDVQKVLDNYLHSSAKKQLKSWESEQKEFYGDKPLAQDQQLSPISVARLAARLIAKSKPEGCYVVPEVCTKPMDLAMYFALQAQQSRWAPKSKQIFQKLALDLTEQHLNENGQGMMQRLIWKEMHDIIVKKQVTQADHVRFDLIGRVGQRLGVDLEEKLLDARQEQLSTKPEEMKILETLGKIQKRRHSVLGRLGLRRVHNVR